MQAFHCEVHTMKSPVSPLLLCAGLVGTVAFAWMTPGKAGASGSLQTPNPDSEEGRIIEAFGKQGIRLRAPNKTLLYKHLQMQNIEGWSERFCHLSCGRRSSL